MLKQELEPIVLDEMGEKGTVFTGSGIEKVRAIEVEYYNEENDRSVYNMVSGRIQESLMRENVQKMLLTDEWELKKQIEPSPTLNRLRISFWREFDRAQTKSTDMKMVKVYAGICPKEQFELYLLNDNHTAWLLKPPVDYVNAMEEALMYGIDRLREILEVPLYQTRRLKVRDSDGAEIIETYEEFDPKTADLLIKTVAMLDMRVKGALVQKVEQKVLSENRNVNATLTANVTLDGTATPLAQEAAKQLGVGNIDEQIKKLEAKIDDDVSKVQAPFTKKELRVIAKKGINIEEMVGIDLEKINKLKNKELETKKSENIPPLVTEVQVENAMSLEKDVFADIPETKSDVDLDVDLEDL